MKFEWKRQEKNLYLPKEKPELITVPKQNFFMISGKGNPNGEEFSEKIGVLYSLAYAVRMMPKQGYTPDGYYEYTVYPLEGIWDLTETGKQSDTLNKNELLYTIMIRQPDFVTQEVAHKAFENVRKKKNHPLLDDVTFETMEDGLSVQMMHIGSYDDEPKSFEQMKKFIKENNLQITTLRHREIYISDTRKTAKPKLKTVLRYIVCHK
ncbi:GyrI-like domain-containing protein [Clostridium sp. OS1-26]|uniref:GyrI-like domain-containing protein n=1 Tax=Clostridium sp. OS1-26 TaxID=3070681 RepID=UPI0027E1D704|nr:GyrI-like domain-containing protein [Clostridium sp. OS1-26]WML32590.1 GyrI-like domain-containing protein [Clostridium sp. OS1-26]